MVVVGARPLEVSFVAVGRAPAVDAAAVGLGWLLGWSALDLLPWHLADTPRLDALGSKLGTIEAAHGARHLHQLHKNRGYGVDIRDTDGWNPHCHGGSGSKVADCCCCE